MNEETQPEQAQPGAAASAPAPAATPIAAPKIERRGAERVPFRVPVQLSLGNAPPIQAKSMDLSTSGIGLICDTNPGQTGKVTISFTLQSPKGSALLAKTQADIAYCVLSRDGFKIGLQFSNPSADLKAALQAFCHG